MCRGRPGDHKPVLTAAILWLSAAAPAGSAPPPVAAPEPLASVAVPTLEQIAPFWQIVIEEQLIIRVPAQRSQLNNFATGSPQSRRTTEIPLVWKEKKAPKCVPMRDAGSTR